MHQHIASAADLMNSAAKGDLSKAEMAILLNPEFRPVFLSRCAAIEMRYTEACSQNDPCLESGCSVVGDGGAACLQPLLRAETEYRQACAAEWIKVFEDPARRATGFEHLTTA